MLLNYKEFGSGFPVIIIHGLYGCSDNWVSFAQRLAQFYRVVAVDLRNHGQSPHSDNHTYDSMVDDVYELLVKIGIEKSYLIGHSMGGRVAMLLREKYPSIVEKLVVVDIASKVIDSSSANYRMIFAEHRRILKSLLDLPINSIKSRKEADSLLTRRLPLQQLRLFLLKNLKWDKTTGFHWKLNLPVLANNIEYILRGVDLHTSPETDVLLVKGANSIYMPDEQIPMMLEIYPKMCVNKIENAGHWVHAEQPDEFFTAVFNFLSKVQI